MRCRAYPGGGLGINLDGFVLHDLHPPQEVVPAYHEVTRAVEMRDRAVNEYNKAIRTKDNTQGAQEEAAKYLKQPYEKKRSNV